jgi:hypothetical protein
LQEKVTKKLALTLSGWAQLQHRRQHLRGALAAEALSVVQLIHAMVL